MLKILWSLFKLMWFLLYLVLRDYRRISNGDSFDYSVKMKLQKGSFTVSGPEGPVLETIE